jgi:hypothetical protein
MLASERKMPSERSASSRSTSRGWRCYPTSTTASRETLSVTISPGTAAKNWSLPLPAVRESLAADVGNVEQTLPLSPPLLRIWRRACYSSCRWAPLVLELAEIRDLVINAAASGDEDVVTAATVQLVGAVASEQLVSSGVAFQRVIRAVGPFQQRLRSASRRRLRQ